MHGFIKIFLFVLMSSSFLWANIYALQTNVYASKEDASSQSEKSEQQKAGLAFLAKNKLKQGVISLPNGLQYKVLKKGEGPKPTAWDTVTVHYEGKLIDGTEFDSSYKRGEPTSFPVNAVIPGWTEALQLMPVGSTWELFIPADLAYGKNGAPPVIGPDQTLIFKVELLSIKKG